MKALSEYLSVTTIALDRTVLDPLARLKAIFKFDDA